MIQVSGMNHRDCMNHRDRFLIHSDEEYLVVTRKINIFALYNVNKHSMLRQKQEKSGTGICHVMQGKESKTCPSDSHSMLRQKREKSKTGICHVMQGKESKTCPYDSHLQDE